MISTPAARIRGPPMPKISTSTRCFKAVASRAEYMSPEASPAERRSGMGGMRRAKLSVTCRERVRERRDARGGIGVLRQMKLLFFVLELVEAEVDSALGEKFLMRALLAEAAFVEHENAVGVLNGAQAVRNDQRGAPG